MRGITIKRLGCVWFTLLVLSNQCLSQKDKTHISLFGSYNRYLQYGSVDDYTPGTNDFPVKPAHSILGLGGAIKVFVNNRMAFEIEGKFAASTKVKLEDPSDLDTLEMSTSTHFSVAANYVYQIQLNRLRPYFLVGGGVDKIFAKEEIYISEYGYEVFSDVPLESDLLDPLIQAGIGIQYFLNKDFGLRADVRYIRYFQSEHSINSITALFGIVFDL